MPDNKERRIIANRIVENLPLQAHYWFCKSLSNQERHRLPYPFPFSRDDDTLIDTPFLHRWAKGGRRCMPAPRYLCREWCRQINGERILYKAQESIQHRQKTFLACKTLHLAQISNARPLTLCSYRMLNK